MRKIYIVIENRNLFYFLHFIFDISLIHMAEYSKEVEEKRYYLQRITFKYYQDPFKPSEATNIDEYFHQIMTFIRIYIMGFEKEQKIPIIIAHHRNRRAGYPEYIHEIRFDFADAHKGHELSKDTVLEFGNNTIQKLTEFLRIFKHLNNGHKTIPIAYWPPKGSLNEIMIFGETDKNGKHSYVKKRYVPATSQDPFENFERNFVNPAFPTMFNDIPEFKKCFSKDDKEEDDNSDE